MSTAGQVVNLLVAEASPNHGEDCTQQLREGGLLLRCRHAGSREAMQAALK